MTAKETALRQSQAKKAKGGFLASFDCRLGAYDTFEQVSGSVCVCVGGECEYQGEGECVS